MMNDGNFRWLLVVGLPHWRYKSENHHQLYK